MPVTPMNPSRGAVRPPPHRADATPASGAEQRARTSALLADGVPLSLLLDLADPSGPHSRQLWSEEAPDLHWLMPAAAADEAEGHWQPS